MATYLMLCKLTPQGTATIKNNPERILEVNREIESLGAKVTAQWATLGEFDFVSVVEAPTRRRSRASHWSSAPAARPPTRPSPPSRSRSSSHSSSRAG